MTASSAHWLVHVIRVCIVFAPLLHVDLEVAVAGVFNYVRIAIVCGDCRRNYEALLITERFRHVIKVLFVSQLHLVVFKVDQSEHPVAGKKQDEDDRAKA